MHSYSYSYTLTHSLTHTHTHTHTIMVLTHFQTMAFSPLLYLAFPFSVMILTPEVFGGTGIRTSIFCAVRAPLNKDFRTSWTKERERGGEVKERREREKGEGKREGKREVERGEGGGGRERGKNLSTAMLHTPNYEQTLA